MILSGQQKVISEATWMWMRARALQHDLLGDAHMERSWRAAQGSRVIILGKVRGLEESVKMSEYGGKRGKSDMEYVWMGADYS